MDLDDRNFGIKVKKKLLDMGMQQIELARKVSISEGYLSEILSGKKEGLEIRPKILAVINTEAEREVIQNGG